MVETEWTHLPLAWSLSLLHLQQPPETEKTITEGVSNGLYEHLREVRLFLRARAVITFLMRAL